MSIYDLCKSSKITWIKEWCSIFYTTLIDLYTIYVGEVKKKKQTKQLNYKNDILFFFIQSYRFIYDLHRSDKIAK